jgi:tight adherence protein C
LPDALDMIVICLEGGLSLPAAFSRVTEELYTAYPLLATEMIIVRKEMELGRSPGEAFQGLADRFDIDEVRSMAALITQGQRFGASLVRTLRIQADSLRQKRHQYAEAQAHKAPLKLIFPTVLCIFPALYIVLMGPALVQLFDMLSQLAR